MLAFKANGDHPTSRAWKFPSFPAFPCPIAVTFWDQARRGGIGACELGSWCRRKTECQGKRQRCPGGPLPKECRLSRLVGRRGSGLDVAPRGQGRQGQG